MEDIEHPLGVVIAEKQAAEIFPFSSRTSMPSRVGRAVGHSDYELTLEIVRWRI
jgi:hypothetical protein